MRFAFQSLRGKLLISFAAIIALSVLMTSGVFAYLLRDYQAGQEEDRLQETAETSALSVYRDIRMGASLSDVETQLDQEAVDSATRILLTDSRGVVLHDTDGGQLVDQLLPIPSDVGQRQGVLQGYLTTSGSGPVYAVAAPTPQLGLRLFVVAPEQTLTNAWRELLPRLLLAALSAFFVSVPIAWWVAGSIARPLVRITRASEEMAEGKYEQELPAATTADEVGRLATAFSTMAREVARSHRAMRDLLANVSHDLRTPLTSIQGFAGALVDGTLTGQEGAGEAGRVICEEADRMRRLVEDLLYLGRIESGEVTIEHRPLDLSDLALAAQVRFTFRADEAHVALNLDLADSVMVLGDAHRLAQVLDNLLDNAVKHTPAGGTVTLRVSEDASELPLPPPRGPDSAGMALLSVQNSGSVIPADEIERVFERFYQVDKARTMGEGRGLGLAIAREIVQAHGGSISVESDAARGTVFTVALPLVGRTAMRPLTSAAGGATRNARRAVSAR